MSISVHSPDQSKDAPKAVVKTLGTTQVQHPGHPLRPAPDPRADGARPEVGAALAGVRHAEGVRHVHTGGGDPQGGPAGDKQVRKSTPEMQTFFSLAINARMG